MYPRRDTLKYYSLMLLMLICIIDDNMRCVHGQYNVSVTRKSASSEQIVACVRRRN